MAIDLESIWNYALEEVSGRNLGVELNVQTSQDETAVPHYVARVLHVEGQAGQTLILQRIFSRTGEPSYFHPGRRMDVVLTSDGSRYAASYELTALEPFELSKDRRVMGMRMCRVGPVLSAQRRNSFRVDTTALDIGVSIRLLNREGFHEARTSGALLVNLSAQGLAIQTHSDVLGSHSLEGETIEVTLTCPQWPAPLLLVGKVVRYEPIKSGFAMLGVNIIFADTKDGRHLRDYLLKLTTELQREYLRRISGNH